MLVKRSSARETVERLKDRRQRSRRQAGVLLFVFLALLAGGFVWLTWQPYARIATLSLLPENPRLLALVKEQLAGSYLGLAPHDSSFFLSEQAIRRTLLEADTGIRAVSIERELTRLSITLHERVPVARWCDTECYLFDADGLVYAPAATGTSPLNAFIIYDTLVGGGALPLGATLAHASAMPNLFDFARKLGTLGLPAQTGPSVESITLEGDEAELLLVSGTRITYVLGSEETAYTNLISAEEKLNLADGSLDYVDLRFSGKVYLKRRGDTVVE